MCEHIDTAANERDRPPTKGDLCFVYMRVMFLPGAKSRVTAALNKLVQTPGRHQTPRARASAKSPIRVPVYIFVFSGAFNKPLFAVSLLGPASGNGGWGAL